MNSSKTVFFAIGVLLVILGAFMLIPFFVQFIYDEKNNAFLLSATVTAFIGTLFVLTNLEVNRKLNLQQVFLLKFPCLEYYQESFLIHPYHQKKL